MQLHFVLFFLALVLISTGVQGWYNQRNVVVSQPLSSKFLSNSKKSLYMKKNFLPPRYQNLWGQGESSKIVDNSAYTPTNMEDYKMPFQQKQVFQWQPQAMAEW